MYTLSIHFSIFFLGNTQSNHSHDLLLVNTDQYRIFSRGNILHGGALVPLFSLKNETLQLIKKWYVESQCVAKSKSIPGE